MFIPPPPAFSTRSSRKGQGPKPTETDTYVNYKGTLIDGTQFDARTDAARPRRGPREALPDIGTPRARGCPTSGRRRSNAARPRAGPLTAEPQVGALRGERRRVFGLACRWTQPASIEGVGAGASTSTSTSGAGARRPSSAWNGASSFAKTSASGATALPLQNIS